MESLGENRTKQQQQQQQHNQPKNHRILGSAPAAHLHLWKNFFSFSLFPFILYSLKDKCCSGWQGTMVCTNIHCSKAGPSHRPRFLNLSKRSRFIQGSQGWNSSRRSSRNHELQLADLFADSHLARSLYTAQDHLARKCCCPQSAGPSGAGVAAVPRWCPGLKLSLMTCIWLLHTPESKPRPSCELRRYTMMQDRTIWQVMILANGLLLHGLGWWGVVEGLYKGLRLGVE